jgi:hypothetical protein
MYLTKQLFTQYNNNNNNNNNNDNDNNNNKEHLKLCLCNGPKLRFLQDILVLVNKLL